MKGRWESNVNVWFPFMYSQNWNIAASLFPKQNYDVLSPNSSVRDLYNIQYISRIGLPILLQGNMHCYKNYLKWSSPLEKYRPGNEKPPCWCRNILPLAHTDILHSSMLGISSGIWSSAFSVMLQENSVRASNYKCLKKNVGDSPHGKGKSRTYRHFS